MIQQGLLLSGLTISEKQADSITKILIKVVESMPARFALLSDISGQVVGAIGDFEKINLLALSSLAVSDLAASQEIARITGEYHDQQIILREGKNARMLMAEAGEHLVLFFQVSNEVPLGWARVVMLKTTNILAEIVDPQNNYGEDAIASHRDLKYNLDLDDDELSSLIENALGDIWT